MKRLLLVALLACSASCPAAEPMAGYLMGYFTETPRRLGDSRALHLAVSDDALNWTPLNQNKPVLIPELGEKGLRDPFFVRKADGTFVILATNLGNHLLHPFQTIHIWDTRDFITFTNARLVKLHDTGMRTWAPEAYWDPEKKKYAILWSGNTDYFRTYVNYTDDFISVTPPEVYFDPGYNQIDATVYSGEEGVFLYYKDWTKSRLRGTRATSLAPGGFDRGVYTGLIGGSTMEAPLLVKVIGRNRWYLYGDSYRPINNEFYAFETDDIAGGEWTPLSKASYTPPQNCKHATIIPITRSEMNMLTAHWGTPSWNRIKSRKDPDSYVRHAGYKGMLSPYPFDPFTDARWKIVPGLSNPAGVSFESVNPPGHYLRHVGTEVVLAKDDGTPAFKTSATFLKTPGLSDASWASFQAVDAPGHYLRHTGNDLRVEPAANTDADQTGATFQITY